MSDSEDSCWKYFDKRKWEEYADENKYDVYGKQSDTDSDTISYDYSEPEPEPKRCNLLDNLLKPVKASDSESDTSDNFWKCVLACDSGSSSSSTLVPSDVEKTISNSEFDSDETFYDPADQEKPQSAEEEDEVSASSGSSVVCLELTQNQETCFSTCQSSSKLLGDLLTILGRPPAYTVLRVNTLYHDRENVRDELQQILHKQYESKKGSTPIAEEHNELFDTLIIPSQDVPERSVSLEANEVIVDSLCAVAVLRGADIFAPGVMGAPVAMQVGDSVAVYGDINGQCRRGYTQTFTGEKIFIGNGKALMSRAQLYVETEKPSGVAIRITEPVFDCPSLNSVLTDRIFLQNLPSIVAGHVLNPQPGETVLDMCAAPGGKTTHLATLMTNTGVLVALDKSTGKVKRIQENVAKLKLDIVKSYAHNSTKACQPGAQLIEDTWKPPYPPCTFDRILLDAPCSGLGQRPQIKNKLTLKDLQSYPPYQRKLFAKAVELLKPGGVLVYSTCTITIEENEGLVQWAFKTFPDMQLEPQIPHLGGSGWSSPDISLTDTQLKLLQRFDPSVATTTSSASSCNTDTIGFFIAKFVKQDNR